MHLIDGPFRDLIGEWRFDAIGERGSRVSFRVEFEFKNRLTAAALGSAFEAVCSTIVDAFVLRAKKSTRSDPAMASADIGIEVTYAEPHRAIVKLTPGAPRDH